MSRDPAAAAALAPLVRLGGITLSRDDFFAGNGGYLFRGATFEFQNEFTAHGCRWDPAEQAWVADATAAGSMLAEIRASLQAAEASRVPLEPAPGVPESGLVNGWGRQGLPAAARERRLNRLARLAPELWDDEEVLEILVGFAFPDQGPDLAAWLLERFGGFGAVLAADAPRYAEHPTFAPTGYAGGADERYVQLALLLKAVAQVLRRSLREQIQDRPVIGSWTALLDYLQAAMQHETAEHFRLLFLDRKNILIRDEVQSRGTVDHTPLYPREVVKRALELGASALIMVHNHPSGDPTPSQADIDMTRQVVAALSQVNITVHDHIIVGRNRHTSFKTQKLI